MDTYIPTYRHGLVDTPKLLTDSGGNISGNNDSVPWGGCMNLFPPSKPRTDTRNLRSVVFLSLETCKNVGSVQISLNSVEDLICCVACSTQCWQAPWKYHSLGFNYQYLCLFHFPTTHQKNLKTSKVYSQLFIGLGFTTLP